MGFNGSTGGAAYAGQFSGAAVHHFDSGLHRPQRSAIRQALVDRLGTTLTGNGKPLLKSGGGYLAKIGVLPRPLKGDSEEEIALLYVALQGAAPALAVGLGRMEFEPAGLGGEGFTGELEVAVYSASQNARAFVDGRMSPDVVASGDPTADPGIETMLEHVREILCGQAVDIIGVSELRPKYEDDFALGSDITIWEQRFTATVNVSIDPQRANSDVVTEIELRQGTDGAPIPSVTRLEVP
jgi:hypothetical protein